MSIKTLICNFDNKTMSPVKNWHRQSVLSRDHFENHLKQHNEQTLSASCCIEVHIVDMIKKITLQLVLKSLTLHYAELLQFSLKENLVNNGCPLIAEEVISIFLINQFNKIRIFTVTRFTTAENKNYNTRKSLLHKVEFEEEM